MQSVNNNAQTSLIDSLSINKVRIHLCLLSLQCFELLYEKSLSFFVICSLFDSQVNLSLAPYLIRDFCA